MTFFDEQDAYNCRIDACKLGKFYSAPYVEFKYLDELEDETVVDVLNNRGFCSTDLYVFRTTEVNECGLRIPTYYTDIELFERKWTILLGYIIFIVIGMLSLIAFGGFLFNDNKRDKGVTIFTGLFGCANIAIPVAILLCKLYR